MLTERDGGVRGEIGLSRCRIDDENHRLLCHRRQVDRLANWIQIIWAGPDWNDD